MVGDYQDDEGLDNSDDGEAERTVAHSDHLMTMITNSGTSSQAWLKFLITIQSGLGVGLVLALQSSTPIAMKWFLSVVIPFFGATLGIILVRVIVRHHKWHAWFIKKYGALPGNLNMVFPSCDEELPECIADVEPGYIGKYILRSGCVIVSVWVVAAIISILVLLQNQ